VAVIANRAVVVTATIQRRLDCSWTALRPYMITYVMTDCCTAASGLSLTLITFHKQSNGCRTAVESKTNRGKGKGPYTLDVAPLRSESPLQKRSGMARVLKGFHSFTCTPTRSSAIGMSLTCLCLPSRSW